MKRKRVPLANYVTEYSVRNKSNENIPVYSVTNSQGFCTDYFDKEVASKDKKTYKVVPRGYFAYNPSRINVGSVDWQKIEEKVIVSPLYNVFSVSENMEQQYLYYFLKSDIGRQMIKTKVFGSVRDNLKIEMLKEMTIPERTVEEQKKCVSILDTLQRMISLRTKELAELDMLNRARFVEMFGDPYYNLKGWNRECFSNIFTLIKSGLSRKLLNEDVGIPVIRSSNINGGQIDLGNLKYWYIDDPQGANIEDYILEEGDILINFINSTTQIGKGGIFYGMNRSFIYTTNCFRVKISEKCNTEYFNAYIQTLDYYHQLSRIIQPAVNQSSFTVTNYVKLTIPLPPIELQNKFATFVRRVNKSKVVSQHTTSNPYIQNLNFAVKWL